jgi:predicted tellurium resistance membrane protein TerC
MTAATSGSTRPDPALTATPAGRERGSCWRRSPHADTQPIAPRQQRWIHHNVDPSPSDDVFDTAKATMTFGSAITQILLLDLVFSLDSIITAVGMTDIVMIMVIAVIVAVTVMLLAANPLATFIHNNPTIVMLALGFLLMIGMTLIAEGFGAHVPKGYIYAAMAFSALIEGLNMLSRRAARRKAAGS